jgi:hypothetical protein
MELSTAATDVLALGRVIELADITERVLIDQCPA